MARPKKDRELLHKHQIMFRLTDTEYEIVSESAKTAHLPLAEYARKQIMQQKVTAKYEIVADLPELKKLIAEFGKIGSNLNQIARHFNSGGIHVHIVINSLRKYDVERQGFMERACDSRAGYKHHLSKDYLIHLKQSLMDLAIGNICIR